MQSRWFNICLIATMCSASLPAVSAAQEGVEERSVRVAQKLFEKGSKAYSEKRFADALTLFRKAYTYVPAAPFLYNAARAAEKLGNLEQALSLAEQAKDQKEQPLPVQLATKNDELIESLEAEIVAAKQEAERQRTMQWSWVGYSGLGVSVLGLGLIGGAAYMGSEASVDIAALGDVEDRAVYAQRREDILARQSTGQVLMYSGIGLAAVGGGMVAWDLLSPGESPFQVSAGPGDVGLSFSAKF